MTVKELLQVLEDKDTPVYLSYVGADDSEEKSQQVRLSPRCSMLCDAFNDYLIDSILPIADDDSKNGYGGGLVVYLKSEIKLLKKC